MVGCSPLIKSSPSLQLIIIAIAVIIITIQSVNQNVNFKVSDTPTHCIHHFWNGVNMFNSSVPSTIGVSHVKTAVMTIRLACDIQTIGSKGL